MGFVNLEPSAYRLYCNCNDSWHRAVRQYSVNSCSEKFCPDCGCQYWFFTDPANEPIVKAFIPVEIDLGTPIKIAKEPDPFNNPMAALRNVLPDMYGRKTHAEYLEKTKPKTGFSQQFEKVKSILGKGGPVDHK